jgi:hypothetical protein
VGWKLAEEVAWARPERPGPEWWTLIDIAQDARDTTRQGMPGMDYLMARGKCGKRTIMRRLESLREQKIITVVRKAAPGVKAVYEIAVIHRLPETGDSVRDTRTGDSVRDTRSEGNGCQSEPQRVSEIAPTGDSVRDTPPVSTTRQEHPSDLSPVVTTSVEGSEAVHRSRPSSIERAAWQAAESRKQRNAQ